MNDLKFLKTAQTNQKVYISSKHPDLFLIESYVL